MQRMIGLVCDQLMSLCTHHNIGRLDTDDQIVIAQILDDLYFVKGTLHNALCGHTVIFLHQLFFQRAAVHAHADRDIALLCRIHNGFDPVKASDISRIDTDLVCTIFHGCDRHLVIKMNICHQRNADLLLDLLDCLGCLFIRNRTSDDLTSCLGQSVDLLHRCFHIFCSCIGHGLDQDRIASADDPVADLYYFCMVSIHLTSPPDSISINELPWLHPGASEYCIY